MKNIGVVANKLIRLSFIVAGAIFATKSFSDPAGLKFIFSITGVVIFIVLDTVVEVKKRG